ncbi:MAG TPA: PAS domain S-box protein, partial [Candidatus Hydrogenedentes bacterium]|nr:PAS domain S-box protein [Candidatus Hydrogenedentota bacterium]
RGLLWGERAPLFFCAAVRYMVEAFRVPRGEMAVFFCLALLFACSSLLFSFSLPWDVGWWIWTTMRFLASLVVLGFLLHNHLANVNVLADSHLRLRRINKTLSFTRHAVDHGFEAAFFHTADGRFVDVNEAACRSLGYKREQLMQMTVHDVDPDMPASAWPDFWNRMREQRAAIFESHHRTRTGRVFPVEVAASYFLFGGEEYVFAAVRDITERKRAEEDLRRAHDYINHLIESANVMVVGLDDTGRIRVFNNAAREITGYSIEELGDRNWFETIVPRDRYPDVWKIFTGYQEGGALPPNFENPIVTKSGEERVISWRNSHISREEDGVSTVSFGMDITDRKRAEEAMRASETRYRRLLEGLPQKVFYKDTHSVYVTVNRSMADDLRLTPADFVGKTDFDFFPEEDAEKYRQDERRVLATGELLEMDESYVAGAKRLTVHTIKGPIHDDSGRIVGILGIAWDITARKQMEEALARSNEDLERFAYIASHDLQEPLRAVSGTLDLLRRRHGDTLDEEGNRFLARALGAAERMRTLINDLLAYSRVTAQGEPPEEVDSAALVDQLFEDLKSTIEEHGAVVTRDEMPRVLADPPQLRRVFQNLLSNAIKFHGEEPPKIHITADFAGEFWEFSVSDNGVGIDPEYFDRIFVVFQRLHGHSEYPGTGIGLAICKRIVERHGGMICVESEPGKGSIFRFTIPAVQHH